MLDHALDAAAVVQNSERFGHGVTLRPARLIALANLALAAAL
jgi:hypothetical protein